MKDASYPRQPHRRAPCGARPKASVADAHGALAIAKFPKDTVKDGERASYPEIVDEISRHGVNARADAAELFRRMVFSILISNVDDHLRNHGFLWAGKAGWRLSPAYDLNPTPTDLKARILTTNISLDEGTCSINLALSQAELFGLSLADARAIVSKGPA